LSNKEADADLAIKTKFAETVSNPTKYPVFASDADNLTFVYNNQFNKYSTNPDNFGFDATRYNMSATYLGNLASLKDPRTFFVAEPASALVASGKLPNSYDAFAGAGAGEDLATMSKNAGDGKYSFINRKRYYQTYTAESTTQVGYQELCFNMAEAAHRGWITGQSAETWYQNGIKASQAFYGVKEGANTVTFQKPSGTLAESVTYAVDYKYADYYAQATVKYAGSGTTGLTNTAKMLSTGSLYITAAITGAQNAISVSGGSISSCASSGSTLTLSATGATCSNTSDVAITATVVPTAGSTAVVISQYTDNTFATEFMYLRLYYSGCGVADCCKSAS
jgi:hypothetical protein